MKNINLETWHRKEHFEFFQSFEQPFFNVCATVDVRKTYEYCQQNQRSFFICSLFLLGYSADQIPAFKLRIQDGEVFSHSGSQISCTVLNQDESFSFCNFGNCDDFESFYQRAEQLLAKVKQGFKGDIPGSSSSSDIYCSVLPWLHFSSFSHAQKRLEGDAIPRIVMGKFKQVGQELAMPVSVEVHHALVDGLHVGQYFEKLQHNFSHFFKSS